jgi:hypothetical protein
MALLRLLAAVAFIGMSQGFVLQPVAQRSVVAAARTDAMCAPTMQFGKPKAKKVAKKPKKVVKKVVKKVAKKVVKKVAKKPVKKVAKKVVKKGGKSGYEQRTAGQALQSFSSKVFSTDNWVFQAIDTLTKLPSSKKSATNNR